MFRCFFPLICLIFSQCFSQNLFLKSDIKVRHNGKLLKNAWAGGLHNAQFSSINLDNEGESDLIIFDRTGNVAMPFVSHGGPGALDYTYVPDWIDSLPGNLAGWIREADFDQDGYEDLFTGTLNSKVRVFRSQLGDLGYLQFELWDSIVRTDYPPLLEMYSAANDMPAATDIDGDTAVDILTFELLGSVIEFHRNISPDSSWGFDSTRFAVKSFCFGHFHESPATCNAILGDNPCGAGMKTTPPHSGSTILALDLDGNGLQDVLVGDFGCNSLYALRNSGSLSIAHFDSVELNFPSAGIPINIPLFPAAFFADMNHDGAKDLVAAPNYPGSVSDNREGVWYYENTGSTSNPVFEFREKGFFQNDMIEVGSNSSAAFFDYEGDGLADFIIGNYGIYDSVSGNNIPSLHLYRNQGTAQWPDFKLIDEDFLTISADTNLDSLNYYAPAFADLDNDGDDDMLLGNVIGTLVYFENVAPPGNPANFSFVSKKYMGIDAGLMSKPAFFDLDGDGDFDLLIGNHRGYIHYHENTGSGSAPSFSAVPDTLGNVKVNWDGGGTTSDGHSVPAFADTDGDGNINLLVGTVNGRILIYDSISDLPGSTFILIDSLVQHDFGSMTTVACRIIDSTGETTCLVGDQRGGLQLVGPPPAVSPLSRSMGNTPEMDLEIYPNPGSGTVNVKYLPASGTIHPDANYAISDMTGKLISSGILKPGINFPDLSEIPEGIYIFHARCGKEYMSRKILLLR